jgi:hypothetical protein
VDGATVMLRGEGQGRRTTSVKGRYEFTAVPRGTYSVSVTMPDGFPLRAARGHPNIYCRRRTCRSICPSRRRSIRESVSNGPSIIELGNGGHAQLGVLRLPPPTEKRQIVGMVAWSDGRPVGSFGVFVCEDRSGRIGQYCRSAEVSAGGGFSIAMFAGRTYEVMAESYPPAGRAEVKVRLDGDIIGLRVVLVPRRNHP